MKTNGYEIVVKGYLNYSWERWFDGLQIEHLVSGETRLKGDLPDLAAICGVMGKLCELNLQLISIQKTSSTEIEDTAVKRRRRRKKTR
jgi:hypothetical protein